MTMRANKCLLSLKMVELTGLEPVTYTLRTYRSSQTELQPQKEKQWGKYKLRPKLFNRLGGEGA